MVCNEKGVITMTEQEKKELADMCGWSEDKRVDDIKLEIRKTKYDRDKESSIFRKTLKIIIDKLAAGEVLTYEDVAEFIAYDTDIENIKAQCE